MTMYRQGDILLLSVDTLPAVEPTPADPDTGIASATIAYGEATGHSHVVQGAVVAYDRRFDLLALGADARLVHEEHAPIELPAGRYRVLRQREFRPVGPRTVVD